MSARAKPKGEPAPRPRRDAATPLDETDLRIIECLVDDARLSQRALARMIGMSPPAVSERIARLEEASVIRGYRAVLDYVALHRSMTVFVGIQSVQGEDQRKLAEQLLAMPEVESVDIVIGPMDLMVRLRVRDQEHLRDVFFDQLLPLPGIRRTESFVSLENMEPPNFPKGVLQHIRKGGASTR